MAAMLAALSAATGVAALTSLENVLRRHLPRVRFHLAFAPSSREWRRLKVAAGLTGALLAAIMLSGSSLRVFALLAAAATAAGYFAPDLWLARQSRRRIDAALRDMPDMLDLLRVAIAAGAPPLRALRFVAAEFQGPLAREWWRVCSEADLGLSHEQALSGLADRVPHDEVRTFVDTLRRGHRHGTSLSGALAAQASRARHARAQALRERAARAGPKIQLVVALVLVPSVLLLLAAGVMAELERSGLIVPG